MKLTKAKLISVASQVSNIGKNTNYVPRFLFFRELRVDSYGRKKTRKYTSKKEKKRKGNAEVSEKTPCFTTVWRPIIGAGLRTYRRCGSSVEWICNVTCIRRRIENESGLRVSRNPSKFGAYSQSIASWQSDVFQLFHWINLPLVCKRMKPRAESYQTRRTPTYCFRLVREFQTDAACFTGVEINGTQSPPYRN